MDAGKIRTLLQDLINGVCVVTSKSGETINGMTVAWATQVAWEPPLVMVSIGNGSYTNELITKSKVFAINVLNETQIELAKHFGLKSGREGNKFEHITYQSKETGSPILDNVVVYFDCRLHSLLKVEDHTIFIGEILDTAKLSTEKPLVYRYSDYW